MTDKRFEAVLNEFDEVEYIMDKEMMEDRDFAEFMDFVEDVCNENKQLKQQVQKIHKLINSKIQSARELGSVKTVIALKNLQRALNGDVE